MTRYPSIAPIFVALVDYLDIRAGEHVEFAGYSPSFSDIGVARIHSGNDTDDRGFHRPSDWPFWLDESEVLPLTAEARRVLRGK